MSDTKALVSTGQLEATLDQPNLRVYDCTTYLEPPSPGSDDPYMAVPGLASFEAAHIPGADFLDLQREFSDSDTSLRFMMPSADRLAAAFGRHGAGNGTVVVLYSKGSMMWATQGHPPDQRRQAVHRLSPTAAVTRVTHISYYPLYARAQGR